MKFWRSTNVPAPLGLVRAFLASKKYGVLAVAAVLSNTTFAQDETLDSTNGAVAELSLARGAVSAEPWDNELWQVTRQTLQALSPQQIAASLNMPDTAMGWLERLTHATQSLNFQVSFVVSRLNQETVPYLWRHGVVDDITMEQLNLQNGPGRELIRVGDVVSVFEPDSPPYSLQSGYINGPIPNELLYSPASLQAGYEFVLVGRARVAGRPAQQLRIVSRDNTRFSYQLWLDEQTGMLLKLNTLDLQGNLLEQIQVSSISILAEPPQYFARVNQASLPRPLALAPSHERKHNWEVDYLPKGMTEVKQDIRRLAMTGQVVEYKMFTDGLVDVSVYVQPAADAVGADLVLRHELNTFLTLSDGKAQVTVVGEIPLQTANAIATSLKIKDDNR